MWSLKRKAVDRLTWLLKTTCNLEQMRIHSEDFLDLVHVFNDNGLRCEKGQKTKIS